MACPARTLLGLVVSWLVVVAPTLASCPSTCALSGYKFPINTPRSPWVLALHDPDPDVSSPELCRSACALLDDTSFYMYSPDPELPDCVCLGKCNRPEYTYFKTGNASDVIGSASDACAPDTCTAPAPGDCSGNPCNGASTCKATLTTYRCCCENDTPVPIYGNSTDGNAPELLDCAEAAFSV